VVIVVVVAVDLARHKSKLKFLNFLRKFAGLTLADVRNVLPDDVDVLDDDQ